MFQNHWKDKIQDYFQNNRKRRDRSVPDVQDRILYRKKAREDIGEEILQCECANKN